MFDLVKPAASGLLDNVEVAPAGAKPIDNAAVNRRAFVHSLGQLNNVEAAEVPDAGLMDFTNQNIKNIEEIIRVNSDIDLRRQDRLRALNESTAPLAVLTTSPQSTQQMRDASYMLMMQHYAEQQQNAENMATERRYVENIQGLLSTGNYAEAKMMETLWHTPDAYAWTAQRQADKAYLMREIEEVLPEEKDRGFLNYLMDFMFYLVPLYEGTTKSGIVNTGDVVKDPMDWLLPGRRLRNEAWALGQIMNIRDPIVRAAELKKVAAGLKEKSTFLGWQNQMVEDVLRGAILNKTPSEYETNSWAAIDAVLAPLVVYDVLAVGKGIKAGANAGSNVIKTMTRAGLRRDAAIVARDAASKVQELGPGGLKAETGLSVDDVEEAMAPSALNPNANPNEVGIAGAVNDGPEAPEVVLKRILGDNFDVTRLSEEELLAADAKYRAQLKKDFGRHVHDVKYDSIPLAAGRKVYSPVVTFGTTKDSLFVTRRAAEEQMENLGLSSAVVREVASDNGILYGIEARLPLSESQFYTKINDVKPKNFIWRWLNGSRQTSGDELYGLGELVVAKRQKMIAALEKDVNPIFSKLGNADKQKLLSILVKSEKEQTWFDTKQLAILWARQNGIGDDIHEITDTAINVGKIDSPSGAATAEDLEFLSQKLFADLKDKSADLGKQIDEMVKASGEADEATFWEKATPEQKALMDELTALNATIAKGPLRTLPQEIESFLEPHTYKTWRESNAMEFPPEFDDLWRALDTAADEALATQAKAGEQATRSMQRAARLAETQEVRQATAYLDEFLDLFKGGTFLNNVSGIDEMPSIPLYSFVSRDDLNELVDAVVSADPRWGTRVNGIRALELPGGRFIAWPGHMDFHGSMLDKINDILDERGLLRVNAEDTSNIFIPVDPSKTGVKRFGKVEIARSADGGIWNDATAISWGDFARIADTHSVSGPAFARRVKDAERKADKAMSSAMTGGEATEAFRNAVDTGLTMMDTKHIKNAAGQTLHTNRQKVMSRPMEWTPEIGESLPAKIKNAYNRLVELSNVEHLLRNEDMYLAKAIRGFQTISFSSGRGVFKDIDGIVYRAGNVPPVPNSRVYNISEDVHYVAKTEEGVKNGVALRLTDADINRMLKKEGYIMVRLEQPVELLGRTNVQWVIGKVSDFEVKPLKFEQLGYRAGGHRGYTDKHFAKQVAIGKQGDNGETFLKNPHTFMVGTKAEVDEWTRTMETARGIWNNTDDPAVRAQLLTKHLDNKPGYPSGEEFARMVDDGEFDPAYPVESLYDREHPSDYAKIRSQGWEDLSDIEESGINTYMQTHGRMYTSPKGKTLPDWRGQDAALIDPYEMMNRALNNIASLSSLTDYKMRAVEKWVKTFGPYLDLRGIPRDSSPVRVFQESVFLTDLPEAQRIKNAAEAQRDTIKRVLGWRSDIDREFSYLGRQLVDFVAGDKPGKWNKTMSRGTEWVLEKDPISRARKMAFHMKLGLFNVAQFPMQISTMLAITSLDVRGGLSAMMNMPVLRGALGLKGDDLEKWIGFWVDKGWHKTVGFDDVEDFKEMIRGTTKSGWFEIGGSHSLVNYHGVDASMGAIGKGVSGEVLGAVGKTARAVGKHGTFFFNEAELWNRMTAWPMAWQHVRKQGLIPGTPKFNEALMIRANDLTFNMSVAGAAAWQKGWASIPTQFLSYQARVLEALTGKQFTVTEKLRLLLGQGILYGTAGVPFLAFANEMMRSQSGDAADIGTWQGLAERGIIDTIIHITTGADIQYGERAAVGSFVTDTFRELFGMSKFGEVSFVDVMGGPLYSISKDMGTGFWDIVKYVAAESGGDTGLPLTSAAIGNMAKNISSINNAYKAYMVWNYGQYVTKTGKVALDGLPSTDAFAVFLGLAPGEYRDYVAMQDWRRNRSETIKQVSDQIVEFRRRMWRDPDNHDAIIAEMEMFRAINAQDIWQDALVAANQNKAMESIYDGLARSYEREQQQQRLIGKE